MCIVKDGVMYRILIVEDDEVIAGAIEREIKSWGYEAKQAEAKRLLGGKENAFIKESL